MTTGRGPPRPVGRRGVLAGAAALPLVAIGRRSAAAAFTYRLATTQEPAHPVSRRAQLALDRIRVATGGQLDITLLASGQIGTDAELLAQVQTGGVEFCSIATSTLARAVPLAGIVNTGFAFADYAAVWRAMDGALGAELRDRINKTAMVPVCRFTDSGFRHITTAAHPVRTPDDLRGLRLRVPPASRLAALFGALGAVPVPLDLGALFAALQNQTVDAQENQLAVIDAERLYEVQTWCAMTGHVWDGNCILGNRRAWLRLPPALRDLVTHELDRTADDERTDIDRLWVSLRQELTAKGMRFNDVDRGAFRAALARSRYYADTKAMYGTAAWALLEQAVGKLG